MVLPADKGRAGGVARIFQRGGGGHTGSNNIVMAFSPRDIVGCFLKKRLTKGGVTGTPGPPKLHPWRASVVMDTCRHLPNLDVYANRERTLPAPQKRPNRPSDPEVVRKAASLEEKRTSIRGRFQQDQTSTQAAA